MAAGLVLAAAASSGQLPRSAAAYRCVPAGARVLARNAFVRVYEVPAPPGFGAPTIAACLAGHSGHMTLLAPNHRTRLHSSARSFELAGRVVAYIETQFGVDSGTTRLVVVDVPARRILRSEAAGSYVDAGLIRSRSVTRFVVSARGSIAWIAEATRHSTLEDVWIYAAPRKGPPALLESGKDIAPDSLTLSGSTLHWARAGATRSAPMP